MTATTVCKVQIAPACGVGAQRRFHAPYAVAMLAILILYVAFRWLKLFSGLFALLSMGFIVFTMFAWPFIDDWIRRKTRFSEASVWIGIFGVLAIIGLTVWEAVVAH